MTEIQTEIEQQLATSEPEVEVLLAEIIGGRLVRVYIDHPEGVTVGLCERVSNQLASVREHYRLEVSSPGPERPLSKPEHFRRYLGHRARVRTRGGSSVCGSKRHSFTGQLLDASDGAVTVAADTGVVAIPYTDIQRSNLLGD